MNNDNKILLAMKADNLQVIIKEGSPLTHQVKRRLQNLNWGNPHRVNYSRNWRIQPCSIRKSGITLSLTRIIRPSPSP
jgi:hypothetical protein